MSTSDADALRAQLAALFIDDAPMEGSRAHIAARIATDALALASRYEQAAYSMSADLTVADQKRSALQARIVALEEEVRQYEAEEAAEEVTAGAIREGSTAMMRDALGPVMFDRLWGHELEKLGNAFDRVNTENAELQAQLAQVEGENRRLLNSASMMYTRRLESQLAAMGRVVEAAQKVVDGIENKILDYSAACALRDALAALRERGGKS